MTKKNRIFIYTDGSSHSKVGPGGFGYVATNWNKTEILRKHARFLDTTTNNQAELLATIEGCEWFLDEFDKDKYLVVMTDSRYCSSGYNEYIDKWHADNWITPEGKPRLNSVMWKRMYDLKIRSENRIHFQWVKGKSGDEFNDMAHDLAYNIWKPKLEKIRGK